MEQKKLKLNIWPIVREYNTNIGPYKLEYSTMKHV